MKQLLKITLTLFAILLITDFGQAQNFPVIGKNAKAKRTYEKQRKASASDGWEITPFPGEHPKNVSNFRAAAASNWGVKLVLPDSTRAKIKARAKYRVLFKVYDTAPRWSHPDLQRGQRQGANYTGEAGTDDVNGHSTHVMGIIGGNGGLGVADVLFEIGKAESKAVKVLTNSGSGQFSWFADAVKGEEADNLAWINQGGFVVCNGSFGGGTSKVAAVEDALKTSKAYYLFAAGNTGSTGVNYPGNSDYGIAVASLDENKLRSSYSTMGQEVWVGQPGRNINSSWPGGQYAVLSGTSMATPNAAAIAGLAFSIYGNEIKDRDHLKRYLAWVCSDLPPTGKDDQTGYGLMLVESVLAKSPKDTPALPGNPVPPVTPPSDPQLPRDTVYSYSLPEPGGAPYEPIWLIVGQQSNVPNSQHAIGLSARIEGEPISALKFSPINGQTAIGLASNGVTQQLSDPIIGPTTFKTTKAMRAQANTKLRIDRIDIEVKTKTADPGAEWKKTVSNVRWFSTNRGFGLEAGSNYGNAAYWYAYFLEMILETQRTPKQTVDIIRVEATDEDGDKIILTRNQLRHWPIGSK